MATTTTPEPARDLAAAPGSEAPGAPARPDGAPVTRTRVFVGELTAAASGLLLLVVLFATKWYGVAGVPDPSAARPAISTAESGWNGLTDVRWVIVATAVAAVGTVVLHVTQRRHGTRTDTSRVVTALGCLTALLLVYRVLLVLPTGGRVIDQKLGAVLGLVCALGVALGGYESISEYRRSGRAGPRRPQRDH
ncbi:MAG: hypothetical protein JOZ07_16665 [Solirubrobacterales bacterium]|nr:hypothetical protein [Solirubrobacterales bacterium]